MSAGNPDAAFGLVKGDRIRLVSMGDDPDAMKPGETGTVTGFCATPGLEQVWVQWDSPRNLNLIPGADRWEKIQ